MARYNILNDFLESDNPRMVIDVSYDGIEANHDYRNVYYYGSDDISYEQDKCLNRFDLNEVILDKLLSNKIYSKLWLIDPRFIDLKMAIKLVSIGKGSYLPSEFKDIYELNVLNYVGGDKRDEVADNLNSMDKYIIDNDEKEVKIRFGRQYKVFILNEYSELKKEKEYLEEEKRALQEEDKRLNGKMEYCLDIMKDITIARTKLLQLKK